jgi:uncharacterized oxidoreductase
MIGPKDTILITGGNSGIGLGLAQACHARGAKVIIAGRSRERVAVAAAAQPGMEMAVVDVADSDSIDLFVADITARFPHLNMVINNAGMQQVLDFAADRPVGADAIAQEVATNLTGLAQVSAGLLPLLKAQPSATLVHVGSGLGYVPLVAAPIYSATKAAVHSFTISLRRQLDGGKVRVVEIIPPVVETHLHRGQTRQPPNAMPLDTFVSAAMKGLDQGQDEIAVGLAKVLRIAHRIAPGLFLKIVNKQRG